MNQLNNHVSKELAERQNEACESKNANGGPMKSEAHLVVVVDVDGVPVAIAHPSRQKGAHLRGRLTCKHIWWLKRLN